MRPRKLLCQMGPAGYWLSLRKEYLLRDAKTLFSGQRYARRRDPEPLPYIVKGHTSPLLRRLHGVDMELQKGKVKNLALAAARLNGVIIGRGRPSPSGASSAIPPANRATPTALSSRAPG